MSAYCISPSAPKSSLGVPRWKWHRRVLFADVVSFACTRPAFGFSLLKIQSLFFLVAWRKYREILEIEIEIKIERKRQRQRQRQKERISECSKAVSPFIWRACEISPIDSITITVRDNYFTITFLCTYRKLNRFTWKEELKKKLIQCRDLISSI